MTVYERVSASAWRHDEGAVHQTGCVQWRREMCGNERGSQRQAKGSGVKQRGSQGKPKGSQGKARGSQGEAKGKPREAKGSQGEAKGKPREDTGKPRGSQGEAKGSQGKPPGSQGEAKGKPREDNVSYTHPPANETVLDNESRTRPQKKNQQRNKTTHH